MDFRLRPTNESGRHPLPTMQRRAKIPQPPVAYSAVPASQPTAMMRQTSTPYINKAAPSPYHNQTEADKDQAAATTMVNSGRQPSSPDDEGKTFQQPLEGGHSRYLKGKRYSSEALEAARTLLQLRKSAVVFPTGPPASSEPQPKQRRNWDEEKPVKKAKTTGNGRAKKRKPKEGEPTGGEPSGGKPKPFKCRLCSWGFRRNDHLARHMMTKHDEEKPRFECDICGHLHSRKDNLSQHRKAKHKDAGCAPEPKPFYVTLDDDGSIITKRPATSPAPVTADDGAQTSEGEADTGESSTQPGQEARDDEPSSSHTQDGGCSDSTTSGPSPPRTTTETGCRFTPINN